MKALQKIIQLHQKSIEEMWDKPLEKLEKVDNPNETDETENEKNELVILDCADN